MNKSIARSELSKVVALDYARNDRARPHPASPTVRIHLLGTMRAVTFRGADVLPHGRKARALLGCLCFAGGAPVSRARIAAMLWDRVPDYQARASFRQAVRELVVAFGPLADELISTDRETIQLETSACWIDAVALLANDPSAEKGSRGKLAELCKGELMEDLSGISAAFDQWLLNERSRFTEQLRKLLEDELKDAHSNNAEPNEREAIARRLIQFDPTHEGASRILMRALADRSERVQALMEFKRLQDALQFALDVAPSPETRALYEAIRMFSGQEGRALTPYEPAVPKDKIAKLEPQPRPRTNLRIGVMPFLAMRPAHDENLGFSLAQEVAAALARFRWFEVVAPVALMRGPSPTFMNEDILRRHDLDYVIDGSVTSSGGKYRFSVQLLNLTEDATPVWSDMFELPADRLDLIDERVTVPIVTQIDPVILHIEGHAKQNRPDSALGCVMRAIPLIYSMTRPKYEDAGRLLERALALEPENAMVLAWNAYWNVYYVGQEWAADPQAAKDIAKSYAQRAVNIDPANAEVLAIYAHILAFLHKDIDMALHYFDRALQLNRNLPFIYAFSALTYCYIGDFETALERLERCRELTAFQPYLAVFENPFAVAYTIKGDYERAVEVGRRVVENCPEYGNGYKPLIASLGHLGWQKQAKRYVDKLLSIEPTFTVKRFAEVYPLQDLTQLARYMEGLRLAGVPEG